MRYVTTESAKEFVSLNKEIEYINDYIALQKLRLNDTINLKVTIQGDLMNKYIAPLLLITYIENAFKYGINPDEDSFIHIFIDVIENELQLNIKNSIVQINEFLEEKTEQGLENAHHRLNGLYANK